jgi:hypothetical protein
MRFAILSPIYPYRGGIAQFSGMLYTELVKEGHEVKAFNFKRLYPDILFPGFSMLFLKSPTGVLNIGKS